MKQLRALLVAFAILWGLTAAASPCTDRIERALKLFSPEDAKLCLEHREFCEGWMTCDAGGLDDAGTAIHETAHSVRPELGDRYPLIGGQSIAVCQNDRLMKPNVISPQFPRDDIFVQTYLDGDASSATDFSYLLDEMNAYSRDLNVTAKLASSKLPKSGPAGTPEFGRGVVALMTFLKTYIDSADQRTRNYLARNCRSTLTTLWQQAEQVVLNTCHVEMYQTEFQRSIYQNFAGKLCDRKSGNVAALLGADPTRTCDCLRSEAEAAAANPDEATDTDGDEQ